MNKLMIIQAIMVVRRKAQHHNQMAQYWHAIAKRNYDAGIGFYTYQVDGNNALGREQNCHATADLLTLLLLLPCDTPAKKAPLCRRCAFPMVKLSPLNKKGVYVCPNVKCKCYTPSPAPTSAPARIAAPHLAVKVERLPVPMPRPVDYILRAQIDAAFDELCWRQAYTNHCWLDMQFEEAE
jgi:hypothetical protein